MIVKSRFYLHLLLMKQAPGLVFLLVISLSSCIYHEQKKRTFGDLGIMVDAEMKNIIHVVYTCDGTHYFNDLSKEGSIKNVKYTYYVAHHQLLENQQTKTKVYRWFSEADKFLFYPQEDSLLRVLKRSGAVLRNFRLFNEVTQCRKFALRSFDRGLYQFNFPMKDSLYHIRGYGFESDGFYSIKEMERKAFFGSLQKNNDTLYCIDMDHAFDPSAKFLPPKGRHFFKFSNSCKPPYIALNNDRGDSLFLHHFDLASLQIGTLSDVKSLIAIPRNIRSVACEITVKSGKMKVSWMNAPADTVYGSRILKDFYEYGSSLKHFVFKEDSIFNALQKGK